jgi:tetratricopeptide (TPR) repeat protein/serine/threonine protein kinase
MLRKGDEPIPGYRLAHFLGRGAFGEVWRASAPGGTSAALKFIDLNGKQGLKEYRAVQRVKEVRHAHLLPIYAFWMLDQYGDVLSDTELEAWDLSGSVMPSQLKPELMTVEARPPATLVVAMLLGDKSLSDRLDECRGPKDEPRGIPIEELLEQMEDAAKGIDFLNSPRHDLGDGPVALQHCDIKPQNLLLVGNSVLVCDFGLARVLGDDQRTKTAMAGSPAYMAPEVIRNRKPSHATDQYALAITYFELRTGKLPFDHESYAAVLDAHLRGKLDWSLIMDPERSIIVKATSLEPENRFSTALEMIRALRRAVGHDSSFADPNLQRSAVGPGIGSSVVPSAVAAKPQETARESPAAVQTLVSKSSGGGPGDSKSDGDRSTADQVGGDLAATRETALVTQSTVDSTSTEEEEQPTPEKKSVPAAIANPPQPPPPPVEKPKPRPAERQARRSKPVAAASDSRSSLSLVLWLLLAGGLAFAAWKFWPRDTDVVKPDVPKNNRTTDDPSTNDHPGDSGNDASPANTGTNTTPPTDDDAPNKTGVPETVTATLRFGPADSHVTVDGAAASLSSEGVARIEGAADKRITIKATREGYREFSETRTLAEWKAAGGSIRLEPLPVDYAAHAREMLAQGKVPQAVAYLEQAVAAGNGTPAVYDALGLAKQQVGNYVAAVDAFSKALAANAKFADAYRHRAAAYQQLKKWAEAIADLDRFVELVPEPSDEITIERVAALAGRVYESIDADRIDADRIDADRIDDALRDSARALELAGERPTAKAIALVARGAVRRKRDQHTGAIDDFRAAAVLDAKIAARVEQQLADTLLARGRQRLERAQQVRTKSMLDAAIDDLTESIKLDPKDDAYAARGVAHNLAREYEKALADFDRALTIDPLNVVALRNRGCTYNEQRRFDLAVHDFDAAIRLQPNDHPAAYNNRGLAYLVSGDFEKAIRDYTTAMNQSPEDVEQTNYGLALAYRGRGEQFEKQGNFESAERDYGKALEHAEATKLGAKLAQELKARILDIASHRATALALKGNLGDALDVAEEYVIRHPKDPDAYATRGFVQSKRKQYREAIADFGRAIELAPRNAKYHLQRGAVHYNDQNTNAAIEDLTRAIKLDDGYVEAYKLRALVYKLQNRQADAAADERKAAELSKGSRARVPSAPPATNAPVK